MKNFISHAFSTDNCVKELSEFKSLLDSNSELDELGEILPFFRDRPDLTAFIASATPNLDRYDLLAYELDLFGTFACDAVIGDSETKTFLFVEFEDAKPNSIFVKKTRDAPEWSPRFEHGVSQVIDWFWKLSDMHRTDEFEHIFGSHDITTNGLVVLGRSQDLSTRESKRLKWRQDKVLADSKHISCVTFDQLYEDLSFRMKTFPALITAGD